MKLEAKQYINDIAECAIDQDIIAKEDAPVLTKNIGMCLVSPRNTPQNNLRTTSFISPLIITKMQPSSFTIISWTKLEVSALFQSAQHVLNMFSYKSVNGTNNARPKGSKKNGNLQKKKKKKKKIFTPK